MLIYRHKIIAMTKSILVVGSSNVDYIIKGQRLPLVGETVTDGAFFKTFGGKGANQALAASRAGGKVTFVSCVGNDPEAKELIQNFSAEGINTQFMFLDEKQPTGAALIMLDKDGNNYLSVAPGANYSLMPHHVDEFADSIQNADFILLQMEIPMDTTEKIIQTAYELKKKVVFNAAPFRTFNTEILKMISILIVNETEAASITGLEILTETDLGKNVEALLAFGVKTVIITLGANGALVADDDNIRFVPAFKVQAMDTTAAGDTFCGNLAVALAQGKSLPDSVSFASAASAICVTRLGAQPSIPYQHETVRFLDSNK